MCDIFPGHGVSSSEERHTDVFTRMAQVMFTLSTFYQSLLSKDMGPKEFLRHLMLTQPNAVRSVRVALPGIFVVSSVLLWRYIHAVVLLLVPPFFAATALIECKPRGAVLVRIKRMMHRRTLHHACMGA